MTDLGRIVFMTVALGVVVLAAHGQEPSKPKSALPILLPAGPSDSGPGSADGAQGLFLPTAQGQVPLTPTSALPILLPSGPPDAGADSVDGVPGQGVTIALLNGTSKLTLLGNVSTVGIFSTSRPFTAGLPLFLFPASPFGLSTQTFDMHARQSLLGALFTGPDFLGFKTGGTFLAFLSNDSLNSDSYGVLPFNAYGELKNDRWRFAAGLQDDLFSPRSPTTISLASLFGSGNTGSYRGQARIERYLAPRDGLAITVQGALGEPLQSVYEDEATRLVESNGWPNVEGRVLAAIGEQRELAGGRNQRPFELGISGLVGQVRSTRTIFSQQQNIDILPVRSIVNVWGLGVDQQVALSDRLGLTGELFIGQGLGQYGGGALQTFRFATLQAIRSRGGWGEVYFYFTDKLHLHTGYGIDAPIESDLGNLQILRNQTYYANLIWDLSKTLQVSFEVDHKRTDYVGLRNADGMLFFTQFLLRF